MNHKINPQQRPTRLMARERRVSEGAKELGLGRERERERERCKIGERRRKRDKGDWLEKRENKSVIKNW